MAHQKLKLVITAGGTREYLDPVRFISNASSGQMGYALARAALRAGHTVTLITAPTALKPPQGANRVSVRTSDQMFHAVKEAFSDCDVLIMVAAVSDYKPAQTSPVKLKKQKSELTLHLVPTRDILAWAGRHKQSFQRLVGFALEDRDLFANAEEKLRKKRLDMIVANTPEAIGVGASVLHVKTPDGNWQTLKHAAKSRQAAALIAMIEQLV
ncbi:MAG TPA: phosphopantothenoylcysteine decarboxylase [Phycisphaerales bacterium]|nr:phosphopantothenoylcysteine decarboxylase [Phycisphaerales bacterium]